MSAPALLVAIPLIAGVVAGALSGTGSRGGLLVLAIAWLIAAVALWRGAGRVMVAATVAACFSIGATAGARAAIAAENPPLLAWFHNAAPHDGPLRLTAVLRADATPTPAGIGVTAEAREIEGQPVEGGVRLAVAGGQAGSLLAEWRAGRTVSMSVTLREPLDYRDPGVPSDRARLARQGIVLLGSVKSAALTSVTARGGRLSELAAALRAWVRAGTAVSVGRWSPRSAGVVTAILIGDRSGLDAEDERRLQEAGTYHVIAISGGNIALLTALLVGAGRAARLPLRAAAAASMGLLAFYGYAAGLAPSVLRAAR
jgi:competence protein ComEC